MIQMRTKILGDIFSYEFDLSASKDDSLDSDYYLKIMPDLMTRQIYDEVFAGLSDALKSTAVKLDNIILEFRLQRFDSLDDTLACQSLRSILQNWSVEHCLQSLDPNFLL